MINLVIFDLDGTLLNTLGDLAYSCNYILKRNGFPEHPVESYKYFVGNGVAKLVERALPEDKRDASFVEKIRLEFVEYYSEHSEDMTAPYSGVVDLLDELSGKGLKLAIASNKFISATQSLAKRYFPDVDFVSVLGQREGVPVKPNPQIVYDVMADAGVKNKSEILYIGDSGADMLTAVNAGVKSVGVLWGFRTEKELMENGADFLVESPGEISEIVSRL